MKKTTKLDNNFTPRSRDLVFTKDPDYPEAESALAFVARAATREDKIKYILRFQPQLKDGEILDKKTLKAWFQNKEIYLCFENEDLTMVDRKYIVGLAHRNGLTEEPE